MRWKTDQNLWRRRFALLPVKIGEEWIWLEWFERRFCGEYYEVRHVQN